MTKERGGYAAAICLYNLSIHPTVTESRSFVSSHKELGYVILSVLYLIYLT